MTVTPWQEDQPGPCGDGRIVMIRWKNGGGGMLASATANRSRQALSGGRRPGDWGFIYGECLPCPFSAVYRVCRLTSRPRASTSFGLQARCAALWVLSYLASAMPSRWRSVRDPTRHRGRKLRSRLMAR